MVVLTLGGYVYSLFAFLDTSSTGLVDGLDYRNYVLQNCSIHTLGITQTAVPIATINVLLSLHLRVIVGSFILQHFRRPISSNEHP